ncbi:HET-C-related protein [Cognatilysobacter lacus]|uniref:VWFA domain-containing protein n=1 Tax=Cognatilysobacter lacus TaxID=1643323 RepID=A0A5D8Z436_9GAMM|nr:hypothetical protein FW784_08020 [Lysobacter lacus]
MRVTNEQVRAMRASVYGHQKGFSPKAVEQIAKANEAVDSVATMSAAYWHSERHFTDENFLEGSRRLITLRTEVIQAVSGANRDGSKAREKLGQALHTLQDFYAHSNWVERGNTSIVGGFGKTLFQNPSRASATCPGNPNTLGPNGGGSVTSGYFVGFSVFPSDFGCSIEQLPANKCFHGNYSPNCTGINKDLDAAGAAAHHVTENPFHPRAAALANEATRTYIQGILDDLKGNDRALAALLDVKGTLGFVVDDTGSMGSSIAGVSGTINQMVAEISADPERAPDNYLLVRFGDPNVGGAMTTEDASVLQAAVAAISPDGGGDCPELSQAGLLNAVNASMPDSRLYLFSDATAKDSATVNQVIAAAQSRGVELNYGLTGSCSPIDPAYIRGAAETGGQVFRIRPDEIPKLFTVIKPQLQGNQSTIIRRRVDLGAGGTETIIAPVDTYNTGLTIALSVAENNVVAHQSVRVFRPSGVQVASTDPDVKIVTLSTGLVYAFDHADPGVWKVEVEGVGPFTASVRGNSPLAFSRFDFVQVNADIHGGYDPVAGQPTVGSTMLGEASVVGSYSTAHFSLIDEAGRVLMPLLLSQDYDSANPEHFLGETALPAVPFRISVEGTDDAGNAYRREYPALYRAQPLDVQIKGVPFVELKKDVPQTVTFTVKNLQSAQASYTVRARDDLGAVTGLVPTSLELAAGESKDVQLTLQAPAGSASGDTGRVFVTVTSNADPTLFNSAELGYSVIANASPVCESPEKPTVLWPPNNQMRDMRLADLVHVTDPDGDPVTLKLVGATQDEPPTRAPDVTGVGTDVAAVRAARAGSGDGRVYRLSYEAADRKGGTCSAAVTVHVPHDSATDVAVDSGQNYDATQE